MTRTFRFLLIALCVATAPFVNATDYAQEMQKAFKKTFRNDFRQYRLFGLPVSNFGAGTMYPASAETAFDPTAQGLYADPNTWWGEGVDEQQQKDLLPKIIPGGGTGPLSFKIDTTKKFSLAVVFPTLLKLLSVDSKVDYNKKVQVSISASTADNHRLNWSLLRQYADNGKLASYVRKHLDAHDYLITIDDIVLYDYKASLVIDKNLDANANAKLVDAWKAFSKDSSAKFDWSSGEKGDFSVKAKDPVVVAVFIGKEPEGRTLSVKDASDLKPAPLQPAVMDAISEASRKGTARLTQ